MRQYGLALEKYWVTQIGYFRLVNTVALGMGITDGKILLCNGISEGSKEKIKFQLDSKTIGWFMNASTIPFQMTVVDQICI